MSSSSAIDPSSPAVPSGGGGTAAPPPAAAAGQLAKYESDLADWVHCPSSKTPAGKDKIARISAKIDDLKARVKKAQDAKPPARPAQPAQPATRPDHRALDADAVLAPPGVQLGGKAAVQPGQAGQAARMASTRLDGLGAWVDLSA